MSLSPCSAQLPSRPQSQTPRHRQARRASSRDDVRQCASVVHAFHCQCYERWLFFLQQQKQLYQCSQSVDCLCLHFNSLFKKNNIYFNTEREIYIYIFFKKLPLTLRAKLGWQSSTSRSDKRSTWTRNVANNNSNNWYCSSVTPIASTSPHATSEWQAEIVACA